MNEYAINYICADGFEDTVIVCAVNRIAAIASFEDFGIEDVIDLDCKLVGEEL